MADVEAQGQNAAAAPLKPAKIMRPPSPTIPRLFAAAAMVTLLAIPVVVPVVIMQVTGTSGSDTNKLENNIVAPPTIVALPPEETTQEEQQEAFLRINNAKFERFCRPFYTAGFNAYELVEAAMIDANNALTVGGRSGAQIVDDTLREAAARGLNTIRMWGHTTNGLYPFQIAPGQYDSRGLAALDFVLETARKYGLQVIVSFVDNWKYYNGVDQFLDWSETAPKRSSANKPYNLDQNGDPNPQDYGSQAQKEYEVARHALFFTDPDSRRIYKEHVAFMINRTNTINQRVYKDDPTILSWNLINEPRCESWLASNKNCPQQLQAWLEEMARWVRAQDPNHLITVGSEGFFAAPKTPKDVNLTKYNPASWAQDLGQDFIKNTDIPEIDFATVHAWPDNWLIPQDKTAAFLSDWINSHLDAGSYNLSKAKPVLFEEFGKKLDDDQLNAADIEELRDPIYNSTFASVEDAITSGRPIAGSLFWKWAIPVFQKQDPRGPYGVLPDDSTMEYVQDHAAFMKARLNSVPPAPECGLASWVGTLDRDTGARSCVEVPGLSEAYYAMYPVNGKNATTPTVAAQSTSDRAVTMAQDLAAGKVLVFPTQGYCCKPGTGAHTKGCSQ